MGRNIGQSFSSLKAKGRPGILSFMSRHVLVKKVKFAIKKHSVTLLPRDNSCSKASLYLRLLSSLFSIQHQRHTPPHMIINIRDTSSATATVKSMKAWRLSLKKCSKVQLFIKIISISRVDWKSYKNKLYGELRPQHAEDPEKEI